MEDFPFTSTAFVFPSPVVLSVTGRDAERYLHARLAVNVKKMTPGSASLACALNAQGRLEWFGVLERLAGDEFRIIVDSGDAETIRATTSRYVVADRVSIVEYAEPVRLLHLIGEPPRHQMAASSVITSYRNHRTEFPGTDFVITAGNPVAQVEQLRPDEWAYLRIRAGTVEPTDSGWSRCLPLELGLLGAVAFNKGCYLGQEVIEKVDALGRLPRRLEVLQLASDVVVAPGSAVTSSQADQGTVVGSVLAAAASPRGSDTVALAILKNIPPLKLTDPNETAPQLPPVWVNGFQATRSVVVRRDLTRHPE